MWQSYDKNNFDFFLRHGVQAEESPAVAVHDARESIRGGSDAGAELSATEAVVHLRIASDRGRRPGRQHHLTVSAQCASNAPYLHLLLPGLPMLPPGEPYDNSRANVGHRNNLECKQSAQHLAYLQLLPGHAVCCRLSCAWGRTVAQVARRGRPITQSHV